MTGDGTKCITLHTRVTPTATYPAASVSEQINMAAASVPSFDVLSPLRRTMFAAVLANRTAMNESAQVMNGMLRRKMSIQDVEMDVHARHMEMPCERNGRNSAVPPITTPAYVTFSTRTRRAVSVPPAISAAGLVSTAVAPAGGGVEPEAASSPFSSPFVSSTNGKKPSWRAAVKLISGSAGGSLDGVSRHMLSCACCRAVARARAAHVRLWLYPVL